MLKAIEVVQSSGECELVLTLPFELRQKSRLRAVLDNGAEVGLMLARGTILRGGDYLKTESGELIRVQAADESVSMIRTDDCLLLSRACYHLGNRHVPLQVGQGWASYLHDHVLDDMVRGLGLQVSHEQAPFEPEGGAYGGGHQHAHSHHHEH